MPKVSVLIPTYNYGSIINEAIESVLAQTFTNFELIIVDNCSTDHTTEVVSKYKKVDNRIRYYRNDKNLGLVNNFNKCIEYATGDYLKFLCADDKFRPKLLEKFVKAMDENPSVSIVTCFKQLFGKVNLEGSFDEKYHYMQNGKSMLFATLKYYNFIGEPSKAMIRKSNLHAGVFDPFFTHAADWDMWVKHLCVGDCYVIPEILLDVRIHEQSVSTEHYKTYKNRIEEYHLIKKIKDGKYNIDFSDKGKDLEKCLKKKADSCTRAMYKLIPKLKSTENFQVFFRFLKIAFSERTLLSPLLPNYNKRFGFAEAS